MSKFQLTILGSGTMTPTKKRHPACYLVEINQTRILLDLGHTSLARLVDQGIDFHSINHIFISHFHTDHFADLLPFIHARHNDPLSPKKSLSLTIIGPRFIKRHYQQLKSIFWPEPDEQYPINFIEGEQNLNINNINLQLFKVTHVPWFASLGIKIKYHDKLLVYTGDIGSDHDFKKLKPIANDINLLLIEGGDINKPTPNHFTVNQIIQLTKKNQIKKTIITHVNDQLASKIKDKIDSFPNIILAKDLMKINL